MSETNTLSTDLSHLSRKELEDYCVSLRETSLRYGESVNRLETEKGQMFEDKNKLTAMLCGMEIEGSFGSALQHLKIGQRVARKGWNGKGMWLSLTPGRSVPASGFWSEANAVFAGKNGGSATVLPYITMKTADDKIVPWLASQTDLLSNDWEILRDSD